MMKPLVMLGAIIAALTVSTPSISQPAPQAPTDGLRGDTGGFVLRKLRLPEKANPCSTAPGRH
jgi:hypothetical protein